MSIMNWRLRHMKKHPTSDINDEDKKQLLEQGKAQAMPADDVELVCNC